MIKRQVIVLFLGIILTIPFVASCQKQTTSKKILIVYLSRTNSTKVVAEMIHQKVGGKIVALELENPYPENYRATVEQVSNELKTGFLPPLKTLTNMMSFSLVFLHGQ